MSEDSEDRIGTEPAEKSPTTDRAQSFQCTSLFCCVPKRQRCLSRRKRKDGKKKTTAGSLSSGDIIPQEEMSQACRNISVGDQGSVKVEAIKPSLPMCPRAYSEKDHCIPLAIGPFRLEGEQENCNGKPDGISSQKQGEATKPSKEGLNDHGALCSEMENKSHAAAVSNGLPLDKGTSYQVTPSGENGQAGRPELLGSLLKEVAHEKEQQDGGSHASVLSKGVPCKKAREKKKQQVVPFQELEQSGKQEAPLPDTEIEMQEEQNDHGTYYVFEASLKQRLIQFLIVQVKEQITFWEQHLAQEFALEGEKQVTWVKMNAMLKEDTHEEVQGSSGSLNQEEGQPVELEYPDRWPIMEKNHEKEQSEGMHQANIGSDTSHHETGHKYGKTADQEVQGPLTAKVASCSFHHTAYEKEQEGVQSVTNPASDGPLSKVGEHQVIVQAAEHEKNTTFHLDVTCSTEQQKLAHTNDTPENGVGCATEEKYLEKKHVLLAEHVSSTHHHGLSYEEAPAEGPDHSYSGHQGVAFPGEQENPALTISGTADTLPDSISYEKEQQRKLEGGDSGPENLYDKEELDRQPALHSEGPLALEHLGPVLLNRTSEAEQGARKSGTLEALSLEEQHVECGDDSKKLSSVSSKEKEAEGEPERKTVTFSSARWKAQGEKMEAWHAPVPLEEPPQRGQFDSGVICEEHHRKEKQDLSETRSSCSTGKNEEDM